MSGYKGANFNDRRDAAASARKTMLEKFRAQPAPDDPAMVAQREERLKIAAARDARAAERKLLRDAELARKAAEEVARKAEAEARKAEEAAEALRAKAAALELAAQQKAARDARYAARKARR
jgi:uncharacterized membrane protein YgaE (UPF0421/DUF939 family)